jgi:hypothetical protein
MPQSFNDTLTPNEQPDPLQEAQKKLNSPSFVQAHTTPTLLQRKPPSTSSWTGSIVGGAKKVVPSTKHFFLFSILFFILTVAVSVVIVLLGNRLISSEHVEITFSTPPSIAGGDSVPIGITIANKNPTDLEQVVLRMEFPDGTYREDLVTPFSRYEEELGVIRSGERIEKTINAVVYGAENESISIPVSVHYKTDGSNAEFNKKESFSFSIGSSPVSVSVKHPTDIASGDEVAFVVTVKTNSPTPLSQVSVDAQYPPGFVASRIVPEQESLDFITLGSMKQGEEKSFTVIGTLVGQDNDERVFRFSVGSRKESTDALAVTYISKEASVKIAAPLLSTEIKLNESSLEPIVIYPTEAVRALMSFKNSSNGIISNGEVSVRVLGEAVEQSSIRTSDGYFDAFTNTLLFDSSRVRELASLASGKGGTARFEFELIPLDKLGTLHNPLITLEVHSKGKVQSQNLAETQSSITRTIKISSDLGVSVRSVRTQGNIENTGPWPPEVGQTTTYTIAMTAYNSINSVADGVVTMKLPTYVSYTGVKSPSNTDLSFNEVTRELSWKVGELPASGGAKEALFQVSITPSQNQKGEQLDLVLSPTITGFDRFVQKEISAKGETVSTYTHTDPLFQSGANNVK